MENNLILAIVGMSGAGKSRAISYIEKKGIPFVRFGQITDEGLAKAGLPVTAENEKNFREKLRLDLGMAAYAMQSKEKIDAFLTAHKVIAIDGLYSWEEYIYLKKEFPNLILIHVFVEPLLRYKRLSERLIRPIGLEEARHRDIAEIEKLNKGGPIAIADYLIENNSDNIDELHHKIDSLLKRLGIKND